MAVEAEHLDLRDARESRNAVVSRSVGLALTDEFASVWPAVAPRLRLMLRRRGVSSHDAEEIVQETATRAFGNSVPYTDADDLFRWASVVSGRLAIDLRRRSARLSDAEIPERPDTVDVAAVTEHRIAFENVKLRLAELSARDQEMLLSSFHDEPVHSRRESVRIAVARHRARNRLRALLDGALGGLLVLWGRRSRVWSAPAEAIAYAAVPTVACLIITVGSWTAVSHGGRIDSVPQARAASEMASPPATQRAPVSTPLDRQGQPDAGPAGTPPRAPAPALRPAGVSVPEPGGGAGSAELRPGRSSEPIWCLTPPPATGGTTQCVDAPITVDPYLP